ncbi:collagen alpha-1(III) chain-like [Sarcophilus harrisii]|uniref:collagen alpha-1(III) chain-like n=1 Tax=Sarcophilus harrisii TaxID=9305 RepID=UPI001301CC60|nr:collagen alpha-1(III) chain-like [Sarcophilus harrisii]
MHRRTQPRAAPATQGLARFRSSGSVRAEQTKWGPPRAPPPPPPPTDAHQTNFPGGTGKSFPAASAALPDNDTGWPREPGAASLKDRSGAAFPPHPPALRAQKK